MFFNVFNRAILCAGIVALTACGGGEPIDAANTTVHPASNSAVQHEARPSSAIPTTDSSSQGGGALRIPPAVSMAEREAEQLRMVPYEQAFAMEMQRRAQERPEHLREAGEGAHAPEPAACATPADPARPADCLPAQPGAVTAPPAQAL